MNYLPTVDYDHANADQKEILDMLKGKFGKVFNIFGAMANSPAALNALLSAQEQLSKGVLSQKETEAIALVVGQTNECAYCLAAHTAIAQMAGLSAEETKSLRQAQSADPQLDALVKFVKEILHSQGHPSAEAVKAFFGAGYDKAALVDVIANVALNFFTNYFNHIAETEIDFPSID